MNKEKYQKASLRISKKAFFKTEEDFDDFRKDMKLIDELIDKLPYYLELEARDKFMKPIEARNGDLVCGNCREQNGLYETIVEGTYDENLDGEFEYDYDVIYIKNEFCSKCGQRLDWSEDE